jgi:hypothetical protein
MTVPKNSLFQPHVNYREWTVLYHTLSAQATLDLPRYCNVPDDVDVRVRATYQCRDTRHIFAVTR